MPFWATLDRLRRTALAAGLLFASGAAGLVYEIAWARQLGPLLGHTADAAAVVVAAYFAGLAIGGVAGARLATRMRQPLLGYAIAEAIAALWALALAPVLDLAGAPSLARVLHDASPLTTGLVRAAVALVALLPATIALGATIPLVAAHVRTLRGAAWAYTANLAGAVCGTAAATFVLLGALGVTATGQVAAGLALAAAAIATFARTETVAETVAETETETETVAETETETVAETVAETETETVAETEAVAATHARIALILAILSGIGSAAAQVLFTRALALTFHNSTYTFGAVVTAFLIALAAGAALAARTRATGVALVRAAALAALAGAVLLPGGILALWATTQGLGYFSAFGAFAGYMVSAIGLALLVVAPAVTAMAMLLPLAWRLGGTDANAGATIGRLGAANNLAGAAAALVTALIVVPALGLWNGLAAVASLYAVTGAVLALHANVSRPRVALAVVVAVVTATIARPMPAIRAGDRLLTRWETRYGWLEVHEDPRGERRLRQNIHYGFASSDNDLRQRRMGQLPMLLHPAPRRALFLGLATGITAGGALADPRLERLDAVELIPEVLEAARAFTAWNGGVLTDPRAHLHTGDARFWLRGAEARWDVIVTDLLKPWESQAGYLYTVEHYREVADRLAPGGVYVQWLALWQVAEADVALIADTTRAVFPTVMLVRGDTSRRWGLCAVVASDAPIAVDSTSLTRAAAGFASPPRHPDPMIAVPRRLVELYVGDWPLRPGATLNRDDSLRLELDAPKHDRRHVALNGDRLVGVYRRVWSRLPRRALRYAPAAGEHAWDPDAGVRMQMGAAGEDGTPPD